MPLGVVAKLCRARPTLWRRLYSKYGTNVLIWGHSPLLLDRIEEWHLNVSYLCTQEKCWNLLPKIQSISLSLIGSLTLKNYCNESILRGITYCLHLIWFVIGLLKRLYKYHRDNIFERVDILKCRILDNNRYLGSINGSFEISRARCI